MKPRARRAVIGTAALVAMLIAVLVFVNWGTVRNHVESWHFQATRQTRTIDPHKEGSTRWPLTEEDLLQFAADRLGCAVIIDSCEVTSSRVGSMSQNSVRESLEWNGWHVLEQRLPRRAYVLLRAGPFAQTMELPTGIEWSSRVNGLGGTDRP